MFSALLLFALAATSPATAGRPCPPPGFEQVGYASDQVATTLAAEIDHQLRIGGNDSGWGGPAGMVGRPTAVNLDLYLQPDGKVAALCVVSGERHAIAAVAKDFAPLKLVAPRERLIVPLNVQFIWRSGGAGEVIEFNYYELKVDVAPRLDR
jgi:hypothetical protein